MNRSLDKTVPRQAMPAPIGMVEPHACMLVAPPDGQLLYKMMKVEHLLRSIRDGYLHFNRVDRYTDLPDADKDDGRQLPQDHDGNAATRFAKAPDFSAADYYDRSRARTYACCFSLENSEYIWKNLANESERGKACVVFDFARLRATLNQSLQPGGATLLYKGIQCRQIFSLNYGIVEYVDWDRYRANEEHLPNPIKYTYLKNKRFFEETEFRVALSTLGVGQFVLNDHSTIDFPDSLQLTFDFRAAIVDGTAQQLLLAPDCDADFVRAELDKLRITSSDGSDIQN